jgi:hypothetical protein
MTAIPTISVLQAIMPRSYTVFQINEITAATVSETNADITNSAPSTAKAIAATARQGTKDAGRVHIGGGMMRFHSTKDAGRVHVGGGMMRF